MKKNHSVRGVIPVALAFVIVLALVLIATAGIFWSRVPLSVSYLKRYHAMNYAKAALHETAHRFWGNTAGTTWDAKAWADGTPPGDPTVNVDGVVVTINVVYEGTAPGVGAIPRWMRKSDSPLWNGDFSYGVSATVDYGDIAI